MKTWFIATTNIGKTKTRTHLTICLCLSTQYLMALRTSISCFLVNPFGPTPPLNVIPAVGRKVVVKSVLLLYIPRRSMSNMFSPWGGVTGGNGSCSFGCSALPAWTRRQIKNDHLVSCVGIFSFSLFFSKFCRFFFYLSLLLLLNINLRFLFFPNFSLDRNT